MANQTWAFVVGSRDAGVLFITVDPLRASLIPRDVIKAHAVQNKLKFDEVLGQIAAAAQDLILTTDAADKLAEGEPTRDVIRELVSRGTTISDASFCFVSEVDSEKWSSLRHGFMPIENALVALNKSRGGAVPKASLDEPGGN